MIFGFGEKTSHTEGYRPRHARPTAPRRAWRALTRDRRVIIAVASAVLIGCLAVPLSLISDVEANPTLVSKSVVKQIPALSHTDDAATQNAAAPYGGATETVPVFSGAYPFDSTYNPHPSVLPGQMRNIEITAANGVHRRYLLHVGKNYRPERPAPSPVLFAFAGWRVDPEHFARESKFAEGEAGNDALIVFPAGRENSWEGAPYSAAAPGEDIAFVKQILEAIDRDYLIDRTRVYAAGMSNGGGMAAILGCHAPDVFAGIASVSSAYYLPVTAGCKGKPVPTLDIHGTVDHVVGYEGGHRHGVPYHSVPHYLAAASQRNGCIPEKPTQLKIGDVEIERFNGCAAETEHMRVLGQGHVWNRAPDASAAAWNFLSRQHL
ncbi:alpha/beta hydrolase family esterase [Corynebacterium pseudotuberculosis]|uniref:alpha/beta hydrolase family esterase n=1 Tax=Corynebacterium pseudotuberculosis TaxID=1719 RepID=UPI0002D5138A|nr:PHB depolymerase family esterase [Corynebacterium pseudotuberculosis]AFM07255.2 poly(3-hydroxybutyrate) depolymerase [Corynebacterium pseudotuberculosis Cp162]APG81476.1 Poly(3-hydroxybutyrate) depolymerase [Corynebacterium pseudotuberculosis]WFP68075.1 PHB depolymerase family esterase [Corynebacterium pseudotuberculosis]